MMKVVCLLFSTVLLAYAERLYVFPDNDPESCPAKAICHTLNFYAANGFANATGVEVYFLSGIHYLNTSTTFSIVVLNQAMTWQGIGETKEGPHVSIMEYPAQIVCSDSVGITFLFYENILLSNLTFRNCDTIEIFSSSNVTLKYVSMQSSPGRALYASFVDDISLDFCSFFNNLLQGSESSRNITAVSIDVFGQESVESMCLTKSVTITNTNFTSNRGDGISLSLIQGDGCFISVSFQSIFFANNTHKSLNINSDTDQYDVTIDNLVSTGGQYGFVIVQDQLIYMQNTSRINICITNSIFSGSSRAAINVIWSGSTGIFRLNSTRIHDNAGGFGSAFQLINNERLFRSSVIPLQVVFHNVTFDSNRINHESRTLRTFAITVSIDNLHNFNISNCNFSNNEGTALALYNTYATFIGNNTFFNNTGYNGGGIFMIANSFIFLSTDDTLLSFKNNHARNKGGAINVQQPVFHSTLSMNTEDTLTYCFYQYKYPGTETKYLYFEDNTAEVAGTVLYGGATSSCLLESTGNRGSTQNLLTHISTFVNQSGLSIISSDAYGVCFCNDDIPDCTQMSLDKQAVPGGTISFTVAVVGQHDNTTTGVVSIVSGSGSTSRNVSSASCTDLTYTVEVENSTQTRIELYIATSSNFDFQVPLNVSVNIKPCPVGFNISNGSHICECSSEVTSASTSCNAVEGIVTREGTNWIAYYKNCTLVYTQCPFDYCQLTPVTMSLNYPDLQCALNRSGLLCGRCAEGLSLMLGSNQCGECTYSYIALIIPFAVAGIALVFLLIALNLTVSVGTINGLIFFANIIKLYDSLFFGTEDIPVLGQFINWINLDLGIETCFFAGMDSCAKISLQFIFPFYLWFLIIVIILFSRWFSKVSKFIGNNAVPVLCTLLLLSYTKLLRTIVLVFSYATTSCTDVVWVFDATIPYFSGCHFGLSIFALLVLVILFVPYTLLLLVFPSWELCRSKWSFGTSLYLKLKPFFDAYAGPHNDSFRFWPGLLVLARVIIAMTISVSDSINVPLTVLVALVLILIIILSFGRVYKSSIHILDIFFLLCILVIVYLIQGAFNSNEQFLTYEEAMKGVAVMLSITLLFFLGIMIYHFLSLPWINMKTQKLKMPKKLENVVALSKGVNSNSLASSNPASKSEVYIPDLREPLLESEK